MLKSLPTLADEIVRASFVIPSYIKPAVRHEMHRAQRFVLSDNMSEFLADIGWRAYRAKPERITETIDQMRILARLPHPVTWIEWNEKPLARRANTIYGSNLDPNLVPEKSGWLLLQHPNVETAICGIGFGYGNSNFGSEGRQSMGANPFGIMWSTDDTPLPWRRHPLIIDEDGSTKNYRGWSVPGILTGIEKYDTPQISMCERADLIEPVATGLQFQQLMEEQAGMMRYVLGLLAVINDLPIASREISTSKGYMAKGNYKKFLNHRVITLTVPSKEYRSLANRVMNSLARRAAHMVRGHFRNDWRHPPTPGCDHHWIPFVESSSATGQSHTLVCLRCQGRKIHIREHQRGDTSLGFVTHSYVVEKGEA